MAKTRERALVCVYLSFNSGLVLATGLSYLEGRNLNVLWLEAGVAAAYTLLVAALIVYGAYRAMEGREYRRG